MNKHLTRRRVVSYLVFLILACTMVFGVTYARYTTSVSGTAVAKAAAVEMNTSLDLTEELEGMKPGDRKVIKFQVRNFENLAGSADKSVSEVGQEYSVTVTTTGNLPLTYALAADSSTGQGDYVSLPTGGDTVSSPMVWIGGKLPYSAGGISHTYTLTVTWPDEQSDAAYTDEIDLVTLTVDAKQTQPGEAGNAGG